MELISRPRMSGKTSELIEKMMIDPRIILLTHSIGEADRLKREYHQIEARRFMYWKEYRDRRDLHQHCKVAMDNIDLVLNDVVGDFIEIGTITCLKDYKDILRIN